MVNVPFVIGIDRRTPSPYRTSASSASTARSARNRAGGGQHGPVHSASTAVEVAGFPRDSRVSDSGGPSENRWLRVCYLADEPFRSNPRGPIGVPERKDDGCL